MNINNQFDTISLDENRVLAKLFDHPAQGAIGQKLINFLNRAGLFILFIIKINNKINK